MADEVNHLAVGLGEIQVSRDPRDVLVAYGLGSCVGVAVYDPGPRVAGLLHAVLPERVNGTEPSSAKYVDSGIASLLAQLTKAGAEPRRMAIWLAGGANMLAAPGFQQTMRIGDRNVAAALDALGRRGLKVKAQDVGGHAGRTVRLYVADGRLTVRTLGQAEREI